MFTISHNPDVLTCLANLSNDEVFTPPHLANQMLDLLPQELFTSTETTFLDPFCKSGVFLREIVKRLNKGLETQIPDLQTRLNHIYTKQVFGIAITELTALMSRRTVYCAKTANGKFSVSTAFKDAAGNILYPNTQHNWDTNGRCTYCGANKENYERESSNEAYAYPFIHTPNPAQFFGENMRFDVIIGNPPYQLSDGGFGTSAMPIYQKFVETSKALNPRYITMIIPARWYSGGKGLDDFRGEMLNDNRLKIIHDFPDATDLFPGVQIKGGICYFLWERDHSGEVTVYNYYRNEVKSIVSRPLLEKGSDSFVRYNDAISILNKVQSFNEESIMNKVSSSKPFGLRTFFKAEKIQQDGMILLYQNGGTGYIDKEVINKNTHLIERYKVFIPRAGSGSDAFPHPILGLPFIGEPNSACTETYIVLHDFDSKEPCENLISYVKTKFFRFLVLLAKTTQDASARVYKYVPIQDFSINWTDKLLYEKYGISKEEQLYIDTLIKPMELKEE